MRKINGYVSILLLMLVGCALNVNGSKHRWDELLRANAKQAKSTIQREVGAGVDVIILPDDGAYSDDYIWDRTLKVSSVYNFGDSYSNTGNLDAGFPLMIDYLTDYLGFPLLSPYLRSITMGSNFHRGANVAYGGSTAASVYENHNPFDLDVQVFEFLRLQHLANTTSGSTKLPSPASFSDALFVIQAGSADFAYNLFAQNVSVQNMTAMVVPMVAETIYNETMILAQLGGAKKFLIFNQPAVGCQPFFLTQSKLYGQTQRDGLNCVKSYNDIAQAFSSQLNKTASIDAMNSFQAENALRACCGSPHGDGESNCQTGTINGVATMFTCGCGKGRAYTNSTEFASWDGIHYTEEFNKVVMEKFTKENMYFDTSGRIFCRVTFFTN
ncbi:hypothetical protein SELMODRAFT_431626 [Selaginella moellendorffii]|uniref:Uncharacterized protein n=1 Tax=Selaginella moellendorffii TaxID=88036 RepID=D8TD95_SELML|nr:hypothetical protein SELMODRAFT_431626 [Selaginella moellendorffii]